ncbi:MAG: hypothetical protein Q9M91_08995 [Candidatus Dojkabacteria bacterium]|nr:hypothetical protein [Candidatus Dojkabacteria bacterium]
MILDKETIASPEKYRKEVEKKTKAFIKKWLNNEAYLNDPKVLKEALDDYSYWATNFGIYSDESYYYGLSSSLDLNDPKIKAASNIIHQKVVALYNETQFFTLQLSKIEKDVQKKMLASSGLSEYKHFLEQLFLSGKYTLSDKEERIMNMKSKVSKGNWVDMLSGLLAKEEKEILDKNGKKAVKNFSEVMELISDPNKKVRDKASLALNEIFEKHLDVAEHELNSVLENKRINDEIRGYKRADESRHISDDVETKSVDILVETVNHQV